MDPWLSVVLLGAAIFGFAWLTPKPAVREPSAARETDAAYDRLLEDLEAENRELVDAVAKFKAEHDESAVRLVRQIAELERQVKQLSEQQSSAAAAPAPAPVPAPALVPAPVLAAPASADLPPTQAAPAPSDPVVEAAAPTSIRVRYAELLLMHGKGKSVEQIAKSVGMNKGEVQLILQLARREEEQLA